MITRWFSAVCGVIAAACVAPAADAASVAVQSGESSSSGSTELVYRAAEGERNDLTLTADDGPSPSGCCVWTVHDRGAVIAPGASCASIDAHTVRCVPLAAVGSVDAARAALRDLDDRLTLHDRTSDGVLGLRTHGGPGDDLIRGGGFADEITGGDGNDRLYGRGGSDDVLEGDGGDDQLYGGADVDFLDGGGGFDELHGRGGDDWLSDGDRDGLSGEPDPGPDLLDGGNGQDDVSYENRTARVLVDLADARGDGERGEGDLLRHVEGVAGGRAGDRLAGTDRSNRLWGGPGDDRLIGRGGGDLLNSGSWLSCGQGPDTVVNLGPRDFIQPSCEELQHYGRGGGDAVTLPPNPRTVGEWSTHFRINCPDPFVYQRKPCSGTLRIRRAFGPHHPLLATGTFPGGAAEHRDVVAWLTSTGHRLATRPRGVRATVALDGPHFGPPIRWTIILKVP